MAVKHKTNMHKVMMKILQSKLSNVVTKTV